MGTPQRAALYARISLDRKDGAGVERQLEDGHELVAERGFDLVEVYEDNSISAYRKKQRPRWDDLIKDVAAGKIDVVVCWHTDRTYRSMCDIEDLIDLVETTGVSIASVKSGDMDLSTPAGRKTARDWATGNRYFVEHMSEQVARSRRQDAARGKPTCGGVRPFGYDFDKVTIRLDEARLIREAAVRVAAGGSMWAEAERWNLAGVTTSAGKPWEVSSVRRVLTSPRIAGLRSYKGEVLGPAVWPAIIDRDVHDRILAMAGSRHRGRPAGRRWLLSALIVCPVCERPMYGSVKQGRRAYVCAPAPGNGRGCGRASVAADAVEAKVCAAMEGWLADPPRELALWLAGPDQPDTSDELRAIVDKRSDLTRRYALDQITAAELDQALEVLAARTESLEAGEHRPTRGLDPRLALGAWQRGEVAERRPLIEAFIGCPMVLISGRMANPADRLTVVPRWEV